MGSLKVNYNFQSDFTHMNMLKTEANLNKNMERLATGNRINNAVDDAAGLFIADQLKTFSLSVDQGTKNAQDGVSVAQIAQGSLVEVYNILNDVKAKTIQGANTMDSSARQELQQDINHLVDSIGKIFKDTEFNGHNIFVSDNATAADFIVQYGARGGTINQTLTLKGHVATADAASTAGENGSGATHVLIDGNKYTIDVTSQSAAQASIADVDKLIKAVDDLGSKFGAKQLELEKIISNNETIAVNTREAESRIRNVDFAKETADFTKNNILMQAGAAMLGQAKQQPQLVTQLLR
ncbi:MAG: flagellin [Epsilonproteobacteria bacterium]|nr:flagellin [Campylobacterota bacterium]